MIVLRAPAHDDLADGVREFRDSWVDVLSSRSRSMVEVNSAFNWSLNSPLAGAANPAWMPFTRSSNSVGLEQYLRAFSIEILPSV